MTKTILLEDAWNFLRRHPLLCALPLLLAISFASRYLIIDFGLYSWPSYILLALLIGAGSLYVGFSYRKIMDGKITFRPVPIVLAALSPVLVAVFDRILRDMILQVTGRISTTIAGISNKAVWAVVDGQRYVSEDRMIMSDKLWLFATLCIFLLFFIGILLNTRIKRKDLAPV